ncbi:MAG: F0F1 ATP synthase subunit B, partial [Planctomycetota bacterium]
MLAMIQLLAADDAHGATSAEVMDLNLMPAITTLVVFGIAFTILAVKVWPAIVKGLDERQAKILEEIKAAEESRAQANAALAEYEASLAEARKEASEMINKARADAKTVADDLRSRNEADLTEMKERATRDIDSARRAAVAELHAEAAMLATSIAGKILGREISAEDQQRLVE